MKQSNNMSLKTMLKVIKRFVRTFVMNQNELVTPISYKNLKTKVGLFGIKLNQSLVVKHWRGTFLTSL